MTRLPEDKGAKNTGEYESSIHQETKKHATRTKGEAAQKIKHNAMPLKALTTTLTTLTFTYNWYITCKTL